MCADPEGAGHKGSAGAEKGCLGAESVEKKNRAKKD